MANARHSTQAGNPAVDVMVGKEKLPDAIANIRHSTRILTLSIIGLIHSPHDVHGTTPGSVQIRDNWTYDLESLAFDIAWEIEAVNDVLNGRDV